MSGETVVCQVSVDNISNRCLNSVSISLVHLATFYDKTSASKRVKRFVILREEFRECEVEPDTKQTFANLKLKIPPTCPSLMDSCNLITNEYRLEANVNATFSFKPKFLSIPITIGTVPIASFSPSLLSPSQCTYMKSSFEYDSEYVDIKDDFDGKLKTDNLVSKHDPLYPIYF